MEIEKVHIGECIKEIAKNKFNNDSLFASKIGIRPQNLARQVYKKQSMDTALLSGICKILDYNFFALYCQNDIIKNDKSPRYTVKVEMELTEEEIIRFGIKNKILNH